MTDDGAAIEQENLTQPTRKSYRPFGTETLHIAGPFLIRETRGKDEYGKDKINLDVEMIGHPSEWPPKGAYHLHIFPDGTPLLTWRERDSLADTSANAQLNWAPRACFIYQSSLIDTYPPLFVSVSFDERLPPIARNIIFILGAVLFSLAAFVFYKFLYNIPYIGLMVISTLIFFGLAAAASFLKLFTTLRAALGINFIISRLIWADKIKPKLAVVPWKDLEGLKLVAGQKSYYPDKTFPFVIQQRFVIVAQVGLDHPEFTVSSATWGEATAKDTWRELQLHFIKRRPEYLATMDKHRRHVHAEMSARLEQEIGADQLERMRAEYYDFPY